VSTALAGRDIVLALATVVLNSAAQLLLRGAALRGATPGSPITLLKSPLFLIALVVYAASVLTWVAVLKRVPLPTAIPFVALMYVVVPLAARLVFDDPLTLRMMGGMFLVIVGILVVVRG
jgi:undecaprenyl phosphate-alpha-L-ara4N flippase subunit ArnE